MNLLELKRMQSAEMAIKDMAALLQSPGRLVIEYTSEPDYLDHHFLIRFSEDDSQDGPAGSGRTLREALVDAEKNMQQWS